MADAARYGLFGYIAMRSRAPLCSDVTSPDEYLHELNWPLGAAIALVLLVINLAVMLSYNAVLEGAYKKRMG